MYYFLNQYGLFFAGDEEEYQFSHRVSNFIIEYLANHPNRPTINVYKENKPTSILTKQLTFPVINKPTIIQTGQKKIIPKMTIKKKS